MNKVMCVVRMNVMEKYYKNIWRSHKNKWTKEELKTKEQLANGVFQFKKKNKRSTLIRFLRISGFHRKKIKKIEKRHIQAFYDFIRKTENNDDRAGFFIKFFLSIV